MSLADEILISGGLDLDHDPSHVKGDYTDALDITHNSTKGEKGTITNFVRNQLAFQMGGVSLQSKKYRVTYDATATNQITVYMTDKVTELVPAINFTSTNPATTIENAFTAQGLTATVTENLSSNYVEIELTGIVSNPTPYYDYFISNTGSTTLTIQVIQEAIDQSLVGELQVIGSWDKLGDLFIHSTSQTNLPSTISATITNVTAAGLVTTNIAHGLSNNEVISISGVGGNTAANGLHLIANVTALTFDLVQFSPTGVYASGGTITQNPNGIGEIGVATKNLNTETWTYTRLIRSKQLNFVTKKQHDIRVEETNFQNNDYFTDDYNAPRVFQYKGDYIQDGALTINNSNGIYDYDTVDEEFQLILSQAGVGISYTSQAQGGGSLTSGNKRYAIRLLTENLSATIPTDLTNPIPVYNASFTGDVNLILGDAPGTTTGKINTLTATGLIQDLFKYVELLVVEYSDGAVTASVVKREEITSSTMTLTHTGSESATDLDAAQFNEVGTNLATAKSIEIIDNRLLISNLTEYADKDLTAWAQTFNHSILRKEIDEFITGVQAGEYQDPDNVARNMGYMLNETYRFAVKVRWKKTGGWSRAYHVQDIPIDTDITVTRRVAALPEYDLNNTTNNTVYVPYVEFSNIDFGTLIDGVPLTELIDAISFVRAEVENRTILLNGVGVLCVEQNALTNINIDPTATDIWGSTSTFSTGDPSIVEYPFFYGVNNGGAMVNPNYPFPLDPAPPNSFISAKRNYMALYGFDELNNSQEITFQPDDELMVFGAVATNLSVRDIDTGLAFSYYREFYHDDLSSGTDYTVEAVENIPTNTSGQFGTEEVHKYYGGQIALLISDSMWTVQGGPVVKTATDITNLGTNPELGIYSVRYKRTLASQYGPTSTQLYVTTGSEYLLSDLGNTVGTGVIEVFGGDVFTQSTIIKHRYINYGNSGSWTLAPPVDNIGFGGGFKFYGQNMSNSQLRYDTDSQFLFPKDTIFTQDWLERTNAESDDWTYDRGYNISNVVQETVAFDPNAVLVTDLKARLIYSQNKPQNSFVDQFRTFLPFNFHDEDPSFGEITTHLSVNGELFTLQNKKWKIQAFNARGTLETVNNTNEVIIGSGSVFATEGTTLTTYGCSNKWSVIKGRAPGGSDTVYWVDTIHKKIMRFGRDGTNVISDRGNIASYLINNLTWVYGKDTPADDEGIDGFFDTRHEEAVWVVRGRRLEDQWTSGTNYTTKGQPVTNGNSAVFEQTPDIYQLLVAHTSSSATEPGTGADWETYWSLVPHTNNDYYNEYTLAWNEDKNKFTTFYSYLPKIVLEWQDTFLSPKPISHQSKVFEHDLGTLGVVYEKKETDGYIEILYNRDATAIKRWLASMFKTLIVPFRVDYTTKTQESFLLEADFDTSNKGANFGGIQNDSTTTGDPGGDTSFLFGEWLKSKLIFEKKKSQQLISATIKFFVMNLKARKN